MEKVNNGDFGEKLSLSQKEMISEKVWEKEKNHWILFFTEFLMYRIVLEHEKEDLEVFMNFRKKAIGQIIIDKVGKHNRRYTELDWYQKYVVVNHYLEHEVVKYFP